MNFKHELGKEAKDIVTGFKGIIVSRTQFLTGCNRYGLQKKSEKNSKPEDFVWFDENQIQIIGTGITINQTAEDRKRGGPNQAPKKYGY